MIRHRRRSTKKISSGKAAVILLAAALLAVAVSVSVWSLWNWIMERGVPEEKYSALIEKTARRNGVDPDLVRAVIWRESGFDRTVIGSKGEVGLMQIMPGLAAADWARAKKCPLPSRAALSDPELNIEVGSWFLGRAFRHWSKYREAVVLTLCEYNAGRSRANSWKPKDLNGSMQNRIKIASTRKYVDDIVRKYMEYRRRTAEQNEKKEQAKN